MFSDCGKAVLLFLLKCFWFSFHCFILSMEMSSNARSYARFGAFRYAPFVLKVSPHDYRDYLRTGHYDSTPSNGDVENGSRCPHWTCLRHCAWCGATKMKSLGQTCCRPMKRRHSIGQDAISRLRKFIDVQRDWLLSLVSASAIHYQMEIFQELACNISFGFNLMTGYAFSIASNTSQRR